MYLWLIIIILVISIISVTYNEFIIEPFLEKDVLKLTPPIKITEYNQTNIPFALRDAILQNIHYMVLNKINFNLKPITLEYVRVESDSKNALYFIEVFIYNRVDYTTRKFICEFWIKKNGSFKLREMRPYQMTDCPQKDAQVVGNQIISPDNVTNPFQNNKQCGLSAPMESNLEFSDIETNRKDGEQPKYEKDAAKFSRDYNKWIVPEKNPGCPCLVKTFSPDILNPNLYDNKEYSWTFSRTSNPLTNKTVY